MLERAFGNHVVGRTATPLQQPLHEVPCLVLERGAPLGLECIDAVAGETARHVETDVAVGNLLRPVHQQFRAVVKLRNAARGEKESDGLLPVVERVGHFGQKTVGIVVVEKSEDMLRIGKHVVECKMIVEIVETFAPWQSLVVERLVLLYHNLEVHYSREPRILGIRAASTLPESAAAFVAIPAFSHDIEVGIFLHHAVNPPGHGLHVGIRIGIHADAVDFRCLDPPD